jgi:sulfite reductase alpha subunit-like flavoprotein
MPAAVKAAVHSAVEKEGGKTTEEAQEYVSRMERDGLYTEECWS